MDLNRPGSLGSYARDVKFALAVGEGMILQAARQDIASAESMTAADLDDLAELDADVIDALVQADPGEIAPYLLEDDATKPLADWWWHLGAIHGRTYPAALLPEHLRPIYLDSSRQAA